MNMKKKPKLRFKNHHLESDTPEIKKMRSQKSRVKQIKQDIEKEFRDSRLPEILDADCAIFPRVFPADYFKTIYKTAFDISTAIMKLISLPEKEVKAIFPRGPNRDYLINEFKILKYRQNRVCGSLRFDMAIVGDPHLDNPPKLLEINEIGFDGLARFPFIHEVLFKVMPELKNKYKVYDTTRAEIKNMQRFGRSLVRLQPESYNWDEILLHRQAEKMGFDLRLISPTQYGYDINRKKYPLMGVEKLVVKNGKIKLGNWMPETLMMSFALNEEDFVENHEMYQKIIHQQVRQYGPLITSLFASKAILSILADPLIRRMTLGSEEHLKNAILPARMMPEYRDRALVQPEQFVIKHVDGFGGQQVFMDEQLLRTIKKTPPKNAHEWVLQERIKMNTLKLDSFQGHPRTTIADLGVFCMYDWRGDHFKHFEVGGFIARATNTSWKVNVSSGGAQVGVMFRK